MKRMNLEERGIIKQVTELKDGQAMNTAMTEDVAVAVAVAVEMKVEVGVGVEEMEVGEVVDVGVGAEGEIDLYFNH